MPRNARINTLPNYRTSIVPSRFWAWNLPCTSEAFVVVVAMSYVISCVNHRFKSTISASNKMACGKWIILIMLTLFNTRLILLLLVLVINELTLVFAPLILIRLINTACTTGHISQYILCEDDVIFINDIILALIVVNTPVRSVIVISIVTNVRVPNAFSICEPAKKMIKVKLIPTKNDGSTSA